MEQLLLVKTVVRFHTVATPPCSPVRGSRGLLRLPDARKVPLAAPRRTAIATFVGEGLAPVPTWTNASAGAGTVNEPSLDRGLGRRRAPGGGRACGPRRCGMLRSRSAAWMQADVAARPGTRRRRRPSAGAGPRRAVRKSEDLCMNLSRRKVRPPRSVTLRECVRALRPPDNLSCATSAGSMLTAAEPDDCS